jgi:hypothetical protein
MNVWTNGQVHVVRRARSVTIHANGKLHVIPAVPEPHTFERTELAVSPGTTWCWWSNTLFALDLASEALTEVRTTQPRSLVFVDDERMLAMAHGAPSQQSVKRYDRRAMLPALRPVASIGMVASPDWDAPGASATFFELSAPARVAWPANARWASPPWSTVGTFIVKRPRADRFEIAQNQHGVAIADSDYGIVVLFGPDLGEPSCLRVPAEVASTFDAVPTSRGVVVLHHGTKDSAGVVHHFARDGALLGQAWLTRGLCAVGVAGDRVFVLSQAADDSTRLGLRVSGLGTLDFELAVTTELDLTRGWPSLSVARDGRTVAMGDGEAAELARVADASGWVVETLPSAAPTRV